MTTTLFVEARDIVPWAVEAAAARIVLPHIADDMDNSDDAVEQQLQREDAVAGASRNSVGAAVRGAAVLVVAAVVAAVRRPCSNGNRENRIHAGRQRRVGPWRVADGGTEPPHSTRRHCCCRYYVRWTVPHS